MYCLKKKCFASQKSFSVFHTTFKLDFMTQIIYCIIHTCLYSLYILFKQDKNTNPSLLIQIVKVQQNE